MPIEGAVIFELREEMNFDHDARSLHYVTLRLWAPSWIGGKKSERKQYGTDLMKAQFEECKM